MYLRTEVAKWVVRVVEIKYQAFIVDSRRRSCEFL